MLSAIDIGFLEDGTPQIWTTVKRSGVYDDGGTFTSETREIIESPDQNILMAVEALHDLLIGKAQAQIEFRQQRLEAAKAAAVEVQPA